MHTFYDVMRDVFVGRSKLYHARTYTWLASRCISETVVLSRIFRQKSSAMANALNKIRLGLYDREATEVLSVCVCPGTIDTKTAMSGVPDEDDKDNDGVEPTMLHSHNAVVNTINKRRLDMIKAPNHLFQVCFQVCLQ